jgi:hypothetical protein
LIEDLYYREGNVNCTKNVGVDNVKHREGIE